MRLCEREREREREGSDQPGAFAEGLLTCSVSVPFTSAAALFFLTQGFVERSISVSKYVTEDVALDLCV